MRKLILLTFFGLLLSLNALAHQAFTLVGSEKKTVKEADLAKLEKEQTTGTKENTNLTFAGKEIRLIAITGPEDDMLSYRIQGIRNANLVVPSGATLKILFVNVDVDMRHDILFGHIHGDFPIAPPIEGTAGSTKLTPRTDDGTLQAEEITVKAGEDGTFKYFCSVRGHAKGGMWGNILVGVKPGANLKVAPKTKHVHSPDEDKDHPHDEDKTTEKKSEEKKSESNHPHDEKMKSDADEAKSKKSGEHPHDEDHGETMSSMVNIGDPMTRESSGTAWIPDSSPLYAKHIQRGKNAFMFHGNMFLRYTNVGSDRDLSVAGKGSSQRFDAPSMFMAMYSRRLTNKAQVGLKAMVSLDPIIERGYGYPLLYQSGETYRGEPLHDRQHPHDFFSELAATFSYKFDEKNSVFFYAGLPGEPALGPPAFMHRISAMNNPDAPIGHHWQDASHITWGVLTAGYAYDKVKFEFSAFRGREPDENRWDIESPKLDSFSGRLSFNPTKEWAFQISHGYLKNPEPSEPEIKIMRRTTASAIYNKNFGNDRNFAGSFVWGQNKTDEGRTNSFLFESEYQFQKNAVFGRFERVQKNAHELVLPSPHPEGNLWVGLLSAGYVRDFIKNKGIDAGLGAQATWYTNPAELTPFYGGTSHGGFQIFLRLRSSKMNH